MRAKLTLLPLVLALAACGRQSAPASSPSGGAAAGEPQAPAAVTSAPATASAPATTSAPAAPRAGLQTFVIVPQESSASYHAHEEFFAGALRRIGMNAGKLEAVGTTREIAGQFELDPGAPAAHAGNDTFTVKLNTLTSNRAKRDTYLREIRDDGPSFDKYPLATFKATAVDGTSASTAAGRSLRLTLTGDLTIREITKREAFDVNAQLAGDTLAGNATTHFLLSDFGIGPIDFYDTVTVADPIVIDVAFTARSQRK
jgi:polyisoprenoid-binding protein YceI